MKSTIQAFATYSRFLTQEDATMLTDILTDQQIPYKIEKDSSQVGAIFIGETPDPVIEVKIQQQDFPKVNELFVKQAEQDFAHPDFEHYFSSYSVNELSAVLAEPNEWNAYDLEIARLFLLQKNPEATIPTPNFKKAFQPDKIAFKWILAGYMLCFLSIFGVFVGLAISQAKKTLQSGEIVQIYDFQSVQHGKNMIVFGSISSLFIILYKLRGGYSFWSLLPL
jgi:hypothetical protein